MSTLGEWLDAMVKLRQNKAQVAEYNATARLEGMQALGQGIGGLFSNYASGQQRQAELGLRTAELNSLDRYRQGELGIRQGELDRKLLDQSQGDILANQIRNQQMPPRAMAVNSALQAGADVTPLAGQIPYDQIPLTSGGPFTGGTKGVDVLDVLSRTGIRDAKLEETKRYHDLLEETRVQREKDKLAIAAMGQSTKEHQDAVKVANAHNTGMIAALGQAAGAKTQADWEKAVTVITGLYQAGTKQGFKDLPFPQIPPSPDQKKAALTGTAELEDMKAHPAGGLMGNWFTGYTAAQVAAKEKEVQAAGGGYQYPGPAEYELAPMPADISTNPQDYYPGGPGSPQTTPQSPAGQQGGYSSPAAVRDAVNSGAITLDQGKQILRSKFGFE